MISVVMVSYLGDYPGARSNPIPKFIRAVNSFLDQTLKESELIILSDGCHVTWDVFQEHFSGEDRVKLVMCEKQEGWPGALRNLGIEMAKYPLITYLDTDDYFLDFRLQKIVDAITSSGKRFILDSLYTIPSFEFISPIASEPVAMDYDGMQWAVYTTGNQGGTYQISHYKNDPARWPSKRTARGEDTVFIQNLTSAYVRGIAGIPKEFFFPIGGYMVCHNPDIGGGFDV